MSDGRLARAFGDHYRSIWWDNSSVYVASSSPGRPDQPEPEHMERVLDQIKPRAVLTFGNMATQGMSLVFEMQRTKTPAELQFALDIFQKNQWHAFPHPNCRGLTQAQLNQFAAEIISRYL